jgi:plastocyanin
MPHNETVTWLTGKPSRPVWTATWIVAAVGFTAWLGCSGDGGADQSPTGDGDADGVKGGTYTFQVTVDDMAYAPTILKAENDGDVTLTLVNKGTKPHDLVVDGIPAATLPVVAPGASATITFTTPDREGIYDFHSTQTGDGQTGQLIVQ